MRSNFRRLIYNTLISPAINRLGRSTVRFLAPHAFDHSRYVFPVAGQFKIKYAAGDFWMQSNGGDTIASRAYFAGAIGYDRPTASLFAHLFTKASGFLDIGANTGIYTLMAAQHQNIRTLHAFEPVPLIHQLLTQNLRLNHLDRAHAAQIALGAREAKVEMLVPTGIVVPKGSATAGSDQSAIFTEVEHVFVEGTTLDKYVEKFALQNVDLLKIDTESTEPEVLKGAKKFLATARPAILIEVLKPSTGRAIELEMADLGYEFYYVSEKGLRKVEHLIPEEEHEEFNFLLLPPEKREWLPA